MAVVSLNRKTTYCTFEHLSYELLVNYKKRKNQNSEGKKNIEFTPTAFIREFRKKALKYNEIVCKNKTLQKVRTNKRHSIQFKSLRCSPTHPFQ